MYTITSTKLSQRYAAIFIALCASFTASSAIAELPSKASSQTVAAAEGRKTDKHGMASYDDSEMVRYVRATAYSCMENEPGAHGNLNAAGTVLKFGKVIRSAAADWSVYPLGTKFKIKGLPYVYIVDDYGSALAGTNTIDIYKPTLRKMRHWGTRKIEIEVVQWGSYEKSQRLLKIRRGYWHCRKMYDAIKKKLESKSMAQL